MFAERAKLLKIYIAEREKFEGVPLHEWLVSKACEMGVAGATVIRGTGGFCSHSPVHSPEMMSLSVNLPMVIEIVEQPERIEEFVRAVDHAIPEGLMTLEDVSTRFYDKRKRPSL